MILEMNIGEMNDNFVTKHYLFELLDKFVSVFQRITFEQSNNILP